MNKKRRLAGLLCTCLLLTGCAGMLDRSYESSTAHVDRPVTGDDPSILRVENYQELVSAVLYLVSQCREEGTIQLRNYDGDVEQALTTACLEVAQEDPLGAYAVDYIKHECIRVVSYNQATLSISYRRTPEQIRSIVNVTGASAIRTELQEALADFAGEVVLRVAYFAEDVSTIAQLIRQAYYDTPEAALGMPMADIALYPDRGSQRIVEIQLTYPKDAAVLRHERDVLSARAGTLAEPLKGLDARATALRAAEDLESRVHYDPTAGATAYDALLEETANAEGMALAYALICRQCGILCEVIEGTLNGEPWYWNELRISDGTLLYLDPTHNEGRFHSGETLVSRGYLWPSAPQPEETEEETENPAESMEKPRTETEEEP